MEYDKTKVDDMVLALLYLNTFQDDSGTRAWKSFNWESMNRLFEKGLIADPKSKAKSVAITEQGNNTAKDLFVKFFN
jgi:hypothetical protein